MRTPPIRTPRLSRPALAAGVGGFLVVFLVGLAVLASIGSNSTSKSSNAPKQAETTRQAAPGPTAQLPPPSPKLPPSVTGEATLAYWRSLATICQSLQNSQSSTPDQTSRFLRTQAQAIEDLRVTQVDQEARALARDIAGMFRFAATFVDRFNIDREGVLTILHFVIDAESLGADVLEHAEEINRTQERIASQSRLLRASLSSRFGQEFPHLFP